MLWINLARRDQKSSALSGVRVLFYIGITIDPCCRWLGVPDSLDRKGFPGHGRPGAYDGMLIVMHTSVRGYVKPWERALILDFQTYDHCRNKGKGGEKVSKTAPNGWYVYVVFQN